MEIFSRPPKDRVSEFCRLATTPNGNLAAVGYADGSITLCENATGHVTGLPAEVWSFAVSGYRLLPKWLEARIGEEVNLALAREFTDICGRIAELIELFGEADTVLESTLANTLTREALGFDEPE